MTDSQTTDNQTKDSQTTETMSESIITAKITSEDGLRRTIKIEAPVERVSGIFEAEYRKIQRKVTLKGFRKGRAPLATIRTIYGDEVRSEALEKMVRESYLTAIESLKLDAATQPQVKDITFEENAPFSCTLEVEVFPEIGSVDISGLSYVQREVSVTDEDINNVLESLRNRHSPLTDVTDSSGGVGAAGESDIITVDMKKLEDKGSVINGDFFPDSQIDLGAAGTVKEFREGLVGIKVDEERTITVRYSKDYPDKLFAGQSLVYGITAKKVQSRELVELTDEFAVQATGASSLDDLKKRIREGMTQERQQEVIRDRNSQLISQLVTNNPFEIPAGLVERYVLDSMAEFRKNHPADTTPDEEISQRYRMMGANQLRWKLLSDKIVQQEKIEVLSEDTDNWIKRFSARQGMGEKEAAEALAKNGRTSQIRQTILEEKLIELLKERASISKE